jgi:hypothetical protein
LTLQPLSGGNALAQAVAVAGVATFSGLVLQAPLGSQLWLTVTCRDPTVTGAPPVTVSTQVAVYDAIVSWDASFSASRTATTTFSATLFSLSGVFGWIDPRNGTESLADDEGYIYVSNNAAVLPYNASRDPGVVCSLSPDSSSPITYIGGDSSTYIDVLLDQAGSFVFRDVYLTLTRQTVSSYALLSAVCGMTSLSQVGSRSAYQASTQPFSDTLNMTVSRVVVSITNRAQLPASTLPSILQASGTQTQMYPFANVSIAVTSEWGDAMIDDPTVRLAQVVASL